MGKNQSASNLTNIIKQDSDGSIAFMHGNTMLMQVSSSGTIETTGNVAGTASYASNAELFDGLDSTVFATTGSNTFTSAQYISNTSTPTNFTDTASLYTDGGLRIGKDAYVSGTLYLNNLTVYGTQSVNYITSSQLNIATNIITVNTSTPAVRFGGLAVYDSGSLANGLTGSLLWDSQNNHWVYTNPSGSSYSGGMLISGPRASSLGSEQGTTNNALMKGQGGDHITSSAILENGVLTSIYSTMYVSSSGNVGIGTTSPQSILDIRSANLPRVQLVKTGIISWYLGDTQQDGTNTFSIGTDSGTNYRVLNILNTGNVGIGNTNPTYALTVQVTDTDAISWRNGATEVGRLGILGATTNGWLALNSSGVTKVQLTAGNDGANYFNTTANFGIGTNSPQGKFHVDHGDTYNMGIQHNKTGTYVTETKFGRPSTSSHLSLIYDIAGTEIAEFKRNYPAAKMIFTKETTTHMEISSGGVVTVPLQPAFSMYVSSNVTGPSVVALGGTLFNDGGYYNTSTYRFTAPVAGRYFFSFYVNMFPNNANPCQMYFRVNGTRRGAIAYTLNKGNSWFLHSFQQVIKLNANDYVDVYNESGDRPDYGSDAWGNFSGYLLG